MAMSIMRKTDENTILAGLRQRLRRAMQTLKRMPPGRFDKPAGVHAAWPALLQAPHLVSAEYRKPERILPSPAEITEMEQCLDALLGLEPEMRRIVMARAAGFPWRKLEALDGRSHTTLRKLERRGLMILMNSYPKERGELA